MKTNSLVNGNITNMHTSVSHPHIKKIATTFFTSSGVGNIGLTTSPSLNSHQMIYSTATMNENRNIIY